MIDSKVVELKKTLLKLKPIHDTPIGLVHPYWARKPQNIIDAIIAKLSLPKQIVLDPFMGSGTVVFSAISNDRSVLGSDINPLSHFLVDSILTLGLHSDYVLEYSDILLSKLRKSLLPWYKITNTNEYIERERFEVDGEYQNGNFKLKRIETVTKKLENGKWYGRIIHDADDNFKVDDTPNPDLISKPLAFDALNLIYNSRIAIPKGAKLSHYYTDTNKAAINFLLCLSDKISTKKIEQKLIRLLLSSSLPLLRLSDKKASSQWPYWRPKNYLTSRNPVFVFESRISAIKDMIIWIHATLPKYHVSNRFVSNGKVSVSVDTCAIQNLPKHIPKNKKINLILTDPPYSDHVPYIEYSLLWLHILSLSKSDNIFRNEIVKSDSPSRVKDTLNYLPRLCKGFEKCCHIICNGGYIVWFYQDYNLKHWAELNKIAKSNGISTIDVIPIPKQRRSMKTVTSPGHTLDGDLIIIFNKNGIVLKKPHDINLEIIISQLKSITSKISGPNRLFYIYASIISFLLRYDLIGIVSIHFSDVRKLIALVAKE